MKTYNPHSVDIVSQPTGLYTTQAVGITPSSFSFGSAATETVKSKPIKPPTSMATVTVKDEEALQKRLLKKQKAEGKKQAQAMPVVDIASQEQFSEDVASDTGGKKKKGGRSKKIQLIASDVVVPKMSKTKEMGAGAVKAGSAKGGNSWMVALKKWNDMQEGKYRIPKKGSKEYDEVRAMM
jgi:hypothetical protein